MSDRRQPALRMPKLSEHALHAIEGEVDPLVVERQQPRDDRVDLGHGSNAARVNAGNIRTAPVPAAPASRARAAPW